MIVADLKQEGAREKVSLVEKAEAKGLAMNTDITSLAQVQAMLKMTLETFGQIHLLVNNAGWDKIEPFVKNSPELWDRVISINLKRPHPLHPCGARSHDGKEIRQDHQHQFRRWKGGKHGGGSLFRL